MPATPAALCAAPEPAWVDDAKAACLFGVLRNDYERGAIRSIGDRVAEQS